MAPVRLGVVGYLNARPLVYSLDQSPEFTLRFDLPSQCAELLHAGAIDLGLIPSIEYLRQPPDGVPYAIVPDLAIASKGPVASVALYSTRPMADVRSIALDTSSRTSVALVRVLCARVFRIRPALEHRGPDLADMLAHDDAALLIGDKALFQSGGDVRLPAAGQDRGVSPLSPASPVSPVNIEKIDLGDVWTGATGLPFVWAFWAGRTGGLTAAHVAALQHARDLGVTKPDEIARDYVRNAPAQQAVCAQYLRDNIKYGLGPDERAGLELFYRYAAEAGAVDRTAALRFF